MMKNRKIDLIDISKYAMVLVIFVYVVILIIGQGGDVPMEKVQKNVLKSVKIKEMREAGTQDFKRYYGLNANDYEDVALYLPNDVMGAEELLLVRVKARRRRNGWIRRQRVSKVMEPNRRSF